MLDKKDKTGLGNVGDLIKKNTQELDENLNVDGSAKKNLDPLDESEFGYGDGKGMKTTGEFGNVSQNLQVDGLEDQDGNKIGRRENEISPSVSDVKNESKNLKLIGSYKHVPLQDRRNHTTSNDSELTDQTQDILDKYGIQKNTIMSTHNHDHE